MQNIVWFQILKCEDLLLSFLLYDDHKRKLLLSFRKEKQFEDFIHGLGEPFINQVEGVIAKLIDKWK